MPRGKNSGIPSNRPAPNCFACQWRARSEWCVLDDEDMSSLNDSKSNSTYRTGQLVYNQGDTCSGIFCISSGLVAIRKADEHGNTVLVRLCYPGETIGYRDFFADEDYTTSAEILEPAQLCFVDRKSVRKLLDRNPGLGLSFLRKVSSDLDAAEETILQSASHSVRVRFAHLLLALKDRYATVRDDGALQMRLPLSRQDIADMLGSRPETIARVINMLEKEEVAFFSGRTVVIPDLDPLLDEIEPPKTL